MLALLLEGFAARGPFAEWHDLLERWDLLIGDANADRHEERTHENRNEGEQHPHHERSDLPARAKIFCRAQGFVRLHVDGIARRSRGEPAIPTHCSRVSKRSSTAARCLRRPAG